MAEIERSGNRIASQTRPCHGPNGPFKPTNKQVTIHGVDVDEMSGDKLDYALTYSNATELLTHLGVLPPTPATK